MKITVFGVLVSLLVIASACAHAFLGWPQFKDVLARTGVESKVIAALGVAWHFGSSSMLAFGGIVLHQVIRHRGGKGVQHGPLWVITLLYCAFGLAAFVLREFNPHFLLFVITGILIWLFNHLTSRTSAVGGAT